MTETGDRYVAPPSHRPHGHYAKYVVEKCRCLPCTEANRERSRELRRARSRPDAVEVKLVPALRARRHLDQMAELGIGYKTVCRTVGVAVQNGQNILYGGWRRDSTGKRRRRPPARRISPELEAAILSFRPEMANGRQYVDGAATWALIEDLKARGFYRSWIAEQLGVSPSNLNQTRLVTAARARKVEALHAEWSGRTPPRKRTRWTR